MELKELIKRMINAKCNLTQIAEVTQLSVTEVELILANNIKRETDARYYKKPSFYPNSFYITRLKQGKNIKEIAEELGCSVSSLYKVFSKRGISLYTYQQSQIEKENE